MADTPTITITCPRCSTPQRENATFCTQCGKSLKAVHPLAHRDPIRQLGPFLIFFGLNIIGILVWKYIHFEEGQTYILSVVGLLTVLDIVFAAYNWRELRQQLSFKQVKLLWVFSFLPLGIGYAFFVYYTGNLLSYEFGASSFGFSSVWEGQEYVLLLEIMFTAVHPAFFEELAFRGFSFNSLIRVTTGRQAIIISSLVFFVLHFALVSIYWMLPWALALGWLRLRYNTLWYGIFAHFVHNATVTLIAFYGWL